MRLLIIGGTSFVGRTIVADAVGRGHHVTTFNRGLTGADVAGVEALRGDRSTDDGLRALAGRDFDAVVDPGGIVPAHVLRTARAGLAPHYAYVSSTAVYQSWDTVGLDESAATWPGAPDEDGDPADFAKLRVHKRGCELAVEQNCENALIARAGSIVGPYDNLGQLPWWLTRIADGGRVIAPGDPHHPIQLIDVRDLSTFVLDQVEAKSGGVHNVVHNVVPDGPNTTMGRLLDNCVLATGSAATPVWMPEEFLFSQGVQPWAELPLWVPGAAGFWTVSGAKAHAAGLRTRPFGESVRDTWAWLRNGGEVRPAPGTPPFGLTRAKEQQVLAAWDDQW